MLSSLVLPVELQFYQWRSSEWITNCWAKTYGNSAYRPGLNRRNWPSRSTARAAHIGQIERGRGVSSLEMVVRIANALHVTVDQLLLDYTEYPELVYLRDAERRLARVQHSGKCLPAK